jgi:2-alkyl-3-oxoalkanoate reductase
MRIVVTGVNGFIGGCIANHYCEKGFEVTGIGRQAGPAAHLHKDCNYVPADVTRGLDTFPESVVIHAAALASDRGSFEAMHHSNVTGTANVLKAAARASHFIHVSTSSVYKFNKTPVSEPDAGKQAALLSNYGRSKFMAEQLVMEDTRIPSRSIVRPRAVYGIHDRVILPRLLKLVVGGAIVMPAHITQRISLTHVENLIHAIDLCLRRRGGIEAYNVCDREVYSLEHVLRDLLVAVVGRPLRVVKVPRVVWESAISMNEKVGFSGSLSRFGSEQLTLEATLDIQKIICEMDYRPSRSMHDSYAEIGRWIQSRGGWRQYLQDHLRSMHAKS